MSYRDRDELPIIRPLWFGYGRHHTLYIQQESMVVRDGTVRRPYDRRLYRPRVLEYVVGDVEVKLG